MLSATCNIVLSPWVTPRKWAGRGKRPSRVRAAQHAALSPEQLRGDSHLVRRRRAWVEEGLAVGHRRHDQRALRSERLAQRFDQAERAPLDGSHLAERGVNEKHLAGSHAERQELPLDLVDTERRHDAMTSVYLDR